MNCTLVKTTTKMVTYRLHALTCHPKLTKFASSNTTPMALLLFMCAMKKNQILTDHVNVRRVCMLVLTNRVVDLTIPAIKNSNSI